MTTNKAPEPVSEALLPCPFCGSTSIDPKGWASTDASGPACDDCGASAGSIRGPLAANIAAWNTRTAPTQPDDVEWGEPSGQAWALLDQAAGEPIQYLNDTITAMRAVRAVEAALSVITPDRRLRDAALAMRSKDRAQDAVEPYNSQAEAWNDGLEKAAQIVERYNSGVADPECGGAPGDIRALKRSEALATVTKENT